MPSPEPDGLVPDVPEPAGAVPDLHEAGDADHGDVTLRAAAALSRTREALQRDDAARRRDLDALARDHAAESRDRVAERRESLIRTEHADRRLRRAMAGLRGLAAEDRARASEDRRRAALDRERAAADRRQARIDLARAHLDHLTGVYTRGLGEVTLRHEIDRAQRKNEPFTLAFVDVDGMKALNDDRGHLAGDAFLSALTEVMRAKLRSYDPIVRMGGDEFICGFVGTSHWAAERRVAEIRTALAQRCAPTTISVGIAQMEPGDQLAELIARGDAALYRDKQGG